MGRRGGGYGSAGCEVRWLEAREMVGYGGLKCELRVESDKFRIGNGALTRGESAFCHRMAAMASKVI